MAIIPPPNGNSLSKAGEVAHAEALAVAQSPNRLTRGRRWEEFGGTGFCWINQGGGEAGFASGDFYADPSPVAELNKLGRLIHWGKVLFE